VAFGFVEPFNRLSNDPQNQFTREDVIAALEAYNDSYVTFPIDTISSLTNIPIKKNKRNHQKQADHLEEARAIRDIRMKRQGKSWQNKNGRPSKKDEVVKWRIENPGRRKIDCIRDTKLSKATVYKYWDCVEDE
jgi:hypothetical protein